jgi:acetylornithine aminotransferase
MLADFENNLGTVAGVTKLRGQGLMLAIELDRPCGELVGRALTQGLLINVTAERTIRLLPPLIISDAQADEIVAKVSALAQDFLQQACA